MKKNILSFAFLAASTLFISNLAAKEFVVSRTDDPAPRAGACTGGMATDCSLREAVLAANADNTATSTTPHVVNHYRLKAVAS